MKRIVSINNAIKYFSENTKIETRKNSKGEVAHHSGRTLL